MGYLEIVTAQQEVTAHLDKIALNNNTISAEFPVLHGLIDRRAGYSTREYKVMGHDTEATKAEYYIFSSFSNSASCRPNENQYTLLKKIKSPLVTMCLLKNTSTLKAAQESKRK